MKKEYDFSKGFRSKFYKADAEFNLPIYLKTEIEERMNKTFSDYIVINRHIDDVWKAAANSANFYRLNLLSHTKFEQNTARVGTTFTMLGRFGGETTCYIIEWNPPNYFAWGSNPSSIESSFELTQHDGKTVIYFSRIYDSSLTKRNHIQKWVGVVLTSLKEICENNTE